jgi:hypothetical protein
MEPTYPARIQPQVDARGVCSVFCKVIGMDFRVGKWCTCAQSAPNRSSTPLEDRKEDKLRLETWSVGRRMGLTVEGDW